MHKNKEVGKRTRLRVYMVWWRGFIWLSLARAGRRREKRQRNHVVWFSPFDWAKLQSPELRWCNLLHSQDKAAALAS